MTNQRMLSVAAMSLVAVLLLLSPSIAGQADADLAKSIANYLVSARGVIAKNQALINDPAKGDKGFTPAAFEAQVQEEFKKVGGIDLKGLNAATPAGKALQEFHNAAKEVVAEAQPEINEQGKAFKGFTPAIFGARAGDKFYKKSKIKVKQTSLKFRGDYNRPDDFEEEVLKKFEGNWEKDKPYQEEASVGGRKAVRFMKPLYIAKACLGCHGDPAGEIDISGRVKEGYKEGDLRGAISVILPIK